MRVLAKGFFVCETQEHYVRHKDASLSLTYKAAQVLGEFLAFVTQDSLHRNSGTSARTLHLFKRFCAHCIYFGRWSITIQHLQSYNTGPHTITMFTLATLAFVLTASAFPLGTSFNFTSPGNYSIAPINTRTSCSAGEIVCNGPTQFGLCNPPQAVMFQAVAAGTICEDGQIKQGASNSSTPPTTASPPLAPVSSSTLTVTSTSFVTVTTPTTPAHSSAAATSAAASSASLPPARASSSPSTAPSAGGAYQMFSGDGSTSAGWPAENNFLPFDTLWTANLPFISKSCTQFNQPNNSPQESADIKSAILSVAQSTGVDARFILATMMQESKGCVRVWSTANANLNPGLLQSHAGSGTCNTGTSTSPGQVSNPCPANEITQMIKDGVAGTSAGAGLQQCIAQAGGSTASKFYKAARIYNSGSITASGNLGQGDATHCYASDIANRLTGRLTGGPTGCHLDPA